MNLQQRKQALEKLDNPAHLQADKALLLQLNHKSKKAKRGSNASAVLWELLNFASIEQIEANRKGQEVKKEAVKPQAKAEDESLVEAAKKKVKQIFSPKKKPQAKSQKKKSNQKNKNTRK